LYTMEEGGQIVLVGGFVESIELIKNIGLGIAGIIDGSREKIAEIYRNELNYLGSDDILTDAAFQEVYGHLPFFLSPDMPKIRKKLFTAYEEHKCSFTNVVSLKANISTSAQLHANASIMVQDWVNISSRVRVGRAVRLNTCANVMHDCILGDFVTVAPNAVLLGNVSVAEGCYIGANATILPGIKVGADATIGAGAVVTKDVPGGVTVVGNPAKILYQAI